MYEYCNNCPHFIKSKIDNTYVGANSDYHNVYCDKVSDFSTVIKKKNIEYGVIGDRFVRAPQWCPLKGDSKSFLPSSTSNSPSMSVGMQRHKTAYDLWSKVSHKMVWEDFKQGDILHVGPYMSFERRDIIIVTKNSVMATYRELSKPMTATPTTFYPTSLITRFISKHKIKEFVKK